MRQLLIILSILILAANLFAQAPDYLWDKMYGDRDGWDGSDMCYAATPTSDGGFALNGYGSTYVDTSKGDQWVVKINSDGDTLWTRCFGSNPRRDYGRDIIESYDQGLIVCGHGRVADQSEDYRIRLFKTDADGNQLWEKDFVGANGLSTEQIIETSDSGFAIVGWTDDKDIFLFRADSLGDSTWAKTYGGVSNDIGYGLAETSDGGFMIVGATESYGLGSYDIFIIKTDAVGDTVWTRTFGTDSYDEGRAICKTHDGHYMVTGHVANTNMDIYLIKIQDDATVDWQKSIGQEASNDYAFGMSPMVDNGFLIAGKNYTTSTGETDMYMIKIDANGDSLWSYTHVDDFTNDEAWIAHQADDGNIYLFGTRASSSSAVYKDYWVIKFDASLDSKIDIQNNIPNDYELAQNYPNPFNPITEIKFSLPRTTDWILDIYNIIGQKVETFSGQNAAGTMTLNWDASNFSSGIYFYRLETGEFTNTKKMVLLK